MEKAVVALFLTLLFTLPGCVTPENIEENEFHGENISPMVKVLNFTLIDSENQTYNFSQKTQNKVSIIAFLFTNCIDICPIVSQNLKTIHNQLNESQHEMVEFITITVDPWRDNTSRLQEWKEGIGANWTHLTVIDSSTDSIEMNTLNSIWNNFGVGFQIEQNTTQQRHHGVDYIVNHSTGTVLIDHNGMQRVWWGDYDWIIDLVKEDLIYLISKVE